MVSDLDPVNQHGPGKIRTGSGKFEHNQVSGVSFFQGRNETMLNARSATRQLTEPNCAVMSQASKPSDTVPPALHVLYSLIQVRVVWRRCTTRAV